MMLPNLSALTLATDAKRKERSGSLPADALPGNNRGPNRNAWEDDRLAWRDIVASVWNGKPRGASRHPKLFPKKAYMSPDGDWKKRQYVETAELVGGYLYGTTCRVVRNVHKFDPNGIHKMDMSRVQSLLSRHYPRDDQAYKTLPGSTATTADIQNWVNALQEPQWTSGERGFDLWRSNVWVSRAPSQLSSRPTTDGAGRIDYPSTGQTYIGETTLGRDKVPVPDGLGIMLFADKSFWRGRYSEGSRTNDIGVFTESDGTVTIGVWTNGVPTIKSTTQMAQEELNLWTSEHSDTVWMDRFLVEKPGYSAIAVASGKVGGVLRMANWHTEEAIRRLFLTTNPGELGMGRDTSAYMRWNTRYTQLRPLAVFDVDYSNSYILQDWERYQKTLLDELEREESRAYKTIDGTVVPFESEFSNVTRMDNAFPEEGYRTANGTLIDSNLSNIGVPLRTDTNEKFLLHATAPENLFAILNTSFDVSYSSAGLFGSGLYFADDPGKSDQYGKPVRLSDPIAKRLGLDRKSIFQELKSNAVRSDQDYNSGAPRTEDDYDIFFMFVTRVPLGLVAQVDSISDFKTNRLPESDPRYEPRYTLGDDIEGPEDDPFWSDPRLFLDAFDEETEPMRWASELNEPYSSLSVQGELRYREFIVYKNAVARVSHLVAYCRAREVEGIKGYIPSLAELLEDDGTADPRVPTGIVYKDPFAYDES